MRPVIKNKRILIVDDDSDILDVMQEVLNYEGYEVRGLSVTDNIFPEIMQYSPDVIILDYILNGVNGGQVCYEIKNTAGTSHIPVLMISAYPRAINSLGSYGCDAFIAKPFDLDNITERINLLINASAKPFQC